MRTCPREGHYKNKRRGLTGINIPFGIHREDILTHALTNCVFTSYRTFLINLILYVCVLSVKRLTVKYAVYDLTVIKFDKLMYECFICVICSFGGRVQNVDRVLRLANFILTDNRVGGI